MKKDFPLLKSRRLLLRQFAESDLENVFRGLSHPEVIRYYGVSYNSIEAAKEQMFWFSRLEQEGDGIWWAICSADQKTFLGACGFNNLNKTHKKAEIGFWLLPEYWGQGFITEALALILNYAFGPLGLHRIEAFVESENISSKKALSKLDFIHEGRMKDCEIKNGNFISLDIYARFGK